MASPYPKDPAVRQRRNATSSAAVIEATPAQGAAGQIPALGIWRPDVKLRWHAQTRRWWRAIWGSAIAGQWIDAHLPGLVALARVVDDFWRATAPLEAKQLLAEIRMQEREFGLTPMAARSLGWEFRRPVVEAQKAAAALPPGADPRKILAFGSRR